MPLTYGCVKNEIGWRSGGVVCAGSASGAWYECQCCPYGYHIDLDFVRYCESLSPSSSTAYGPAASNAGGPKRRRQDRRRQRQSMEVLLGLIPSDVVIHPSPPIFTHDNNNKRHQMSTVTESSPASADDIRNSLNEVVQEFELTLQHTKGKRQAKQLRNLPDVTAVTILSNNNHIIDNGMLPQESNSVTEGIVADSTTPQQQQIIQSQPDERDFDAISIESATNLSPGALQNVRTQMALSLERTRHLEEIVKTIPALQEELDELKRVNERLVVQCQYWENAAPEPPQQPPSRPPPPQLNAYLAHRDAAVHAIVLTRTVAVGSHVPVQRTAATQTPPPPEPVATIISVPQLTPKISFEQIHKTSQTPPPKQIQNFSKYTQASLSLPPVTFSQSTQCAPPPAKVSVGVSDDTTLSEECASCAQLLKQLQEQQQLMIAAPVVVPAICPPSVQTKSIAIGTDQTIKMQLKTQASQASPLTMDKSAQIAEQKTAIAHKMSQSDCVTCASKHTQHTPTTQSKAIQTPTQVNSLPELTLSTIIQQPAPSRIPVPRTPPAPPSPTAIRAFRRQDTYTKLPTDEKSAMGLSGLDLGCEPTTSKSARSSSTTIIEQEASPPLAHEEEQRLEEVISLLSSNAAELEGAAETTKTDVPSSSSASTYPPPSASTFEKFEQKFILPKVISSSPKQQATPSAQSSLPKPAQLSVEEVSPPLSGQPSREMQAAVKVLNDSLERGNSVAPGAPVAPHLRTAHQLIEREWFRVSSLVGADPLHVEAYLDHLDAVGGRVLEYVVNMVDSSGNTAMHYSVSHGNFDVVSILLDSKVCDVNRQNLAGYTSLMLVSLAEVRSSTHAGVVRRLFALGDVNVRARGHGQTALMLAVSHGRGDMVNMLLLAGADVNIQDDDGSTALMCAAEHGHVDIVRQFLAQSDCDSRITDVDGCTALRIAMDAGHRHIGVLLYAHERRLLHGPAQSSSAPGTPGGRRRSASTTSDKVLEEDSSSHMK